MSLRRERGAVAVEFALLVPVFLLLITLLIDFSRIGYVQISLNSAARESVRASSFGLNLSEISAVANSTSGDAARLAQISSSATLTVTQVRTCGASTALGRTTEVEVSTLFDWATPLELFDFISGPGALGQNLVIRARGVMVCAG